MTFTNLIPFLLVVFTYSCSGANDTNNLNGDIRSQNTRNYTVEEENDDFASVPTAVSIFQLIRVYNRVLFGKNQITRT